MSLAYGRSGERIRRLDALRMNAGVLLLLVTLGLWLMVIALLHGGEVRAVAEAERETEVLARAYAENIGSVMRNLDLVLSNIADTWADGDVDETEMRRAFNNFNQISGNLGVILSIADKDGRLIASTQALPPEPVSIADRPHFLAHREHPGRQMFLGAPTKGRLSQQWSVHASKAIIKNRSFDGLVVMAIDPVRLGNFGAFALSGKSYTATVFKDDGVVLTRFPQPMPFLGRGVTAAPFQDAVAPPQGTYRRVTTLDGVERIIGYSKLDNYPVVITVGLPVDEVLAGARSHAAQMLTMAGLATILLLISGGLMILQIGHQQREAIAQQRRAEELETKVSERTGELQSANQELELAASVFHNTQEGVLVTDASGQILSVNPAFSLITGYSSREALGQRPSLLKSDRHGIDFYDGMWMSLLQSGVWQGEIWNRKKCGEAYLEWLTINRIDGPDGKPLRYVSVFRDITELRSNEEQVRHLAYHDALTGLPNRALFLDRFGHALALAQREDSRLAVVFMDLDGFKAVNDTFGHEVGDELLQEVARRIRQTLRRDTDTVARLGGDEFVLLIEGISSAETVAQLAEEIIASVRQPITLRGHSVKVGASLGLALFPEDGSDVKTLMQQADTAMYAAKAAGKNTYRFFRADMQDSVSEKMGLEQSLRNAIRDDQLELHYQPKIGLESDGVHGVEALVRWRHPDRGLIAPDDFIPLAEECGLISELGDWVLAEAVRQASVWRGQGHAVPVAVNLSARQVVPLQLEEKIAALLSESGLPPNLLEIELTETALLDSPVEAAQILGRLREMGLTVAIDDFGVGFSSLARLRDLPVDTIKIDRSFISGIEGNGKDVNIVRIIAAIAKLFDMTVVAEGVETAQQAELLTEFEGMVCQGYHYARPMTAPAFQDWLNRRSQPVAAD